MKEYLKLTNKKFIVISIILTTLYILVGYFTYEQALFGKIGSSFDDGLVVLKVLMVAMALYNLIIGIIIWKKDKLLAKYHLKYSVIALITIVVYGLTAITIHSLVLAFFPHVFGIYGF